MLLWGQPTSKQLSTGLQPLLVLQPDTLSFTLKRILRAVYKIVKNYTDIGKQVGCRKEFFL